MQLGILDVLQGKSDEAGPVLAEALKLSLAARSTPWTALSLVAQVRRALGGEQFGQDFADGSALSQRDTVAAARAGPTQAGHPPAEPGVAGADAP